MILPDVALAPSEFQRCLPSSLTARVVGSQDRVSDRPHTDGFPGATLYLPLVSQGGFDTVNAYCSTGEKMFISIVFCLGILFCLETWEF